LTKPWGFPHARQAPKKPPENHPNSPTGGGHKLFEVFSSAKRGGENRWGGCGLWLGGFLALNDAKLFLFIRAFKEISAH